MKNIKSLIVKLLSVTLVVVMAVWMAAQQPVVAATESKTTYYISDIAMEGDTNADAARMRLVNAGYIVCDKPVYHGNGQYTYIGYKVTTNPDEGITNIKAMNMNGGYNTMTYRDFLDSESVNTKAVVHEIMSVIEEFRANYFAQKHNAVIAYNTLNHYSFAKGGQELLLGNYFVLGDVLSDDIVDILLITNNATLMAVYTQLVFAISHDTAWGEEGLIDRLCARGPMDLSSCIVNGKLDENKANSFYANNYDSVYRDRAKDIWGSVQLFALNCQKAFERYPDGKDITVEKDTDSASDFIETTGSMLEDASPDSNQEDVDAIYLNIYNQFDAKDENGKYIYEYGKNSDGTPRSVAQFLYDVGSADESNPAAMLNAYRELYPFIVPDGKGNTVLTDGQETMIKYTGFMTVLSCDSHTPETIQSMQKTVDELVEELHELGTDSVSIWYDIDKSVYDEKVGITSETYRSLATKNTFNLLTTNHDKYYAKETTKQKLQKASMIMGIVIGVCSLVSLASGIIVAGAVLGSFTAYATMVVCGILALIEGGLTIGSTILCILAALGGICFFAALVVGIAAIVISIIAACKDDEEDEPAIEAKIDYTSIPKRMFDINNEEDMVYPFYVVTDAGSDAKAMDICNWSSKEWVALYVSKDPNFGNPISVDYDGEYNAAFFVQDDQYTPVNGFSPVTFFDGIGAARLNIADTNDKGIYLIYAKPADNTGTERILGGKYIKNVAVSCQSTSEAAIADLKDHGYIPIYVDLTSQAGYYVKKYVNKTWEELVEIHTYIGYTTTNDPSDAVTDLRVSYGSGLKAKGDSITFGSAKYGTCGGTGDLIVWQSKSPLVGTPILAGSIRVVNSVSEINDGEEGVNLFSGGRAFNFGLVDSCGNETLRYESSISSAYWNRTFVVFTPETQYKSDGKAYLGGIAFFGGDTYEGISIDDFAAESGYIPMTTSDSGVNMDVGGPQYGQTRLYYSITYNPKRAITGITSYQSEPATQRLPYTTASGTSNYVAADVFVQGGLSVGNNYRLIRASHGYTTSSLNEGGSGYFDGKTNFDTYYRELTGEKYVVTYGPYSTYEFLTRLHDIGAPLGFEKNDDGILVLKSLPEMVLYVCGPDGTDPISADGLVISSGNTMDSSYTPVRSLTDWYAGEAVNLCYNDYYHSGEFYLFYKKPIVNRAKYIASVTVKAYDNSTTVPNPFDMAVLMLQSKGPGTLIKVNFAGNRDKPWLYSLTNNGYEYYPDRPASRECGGFVLNKSRDYMTMTLGYDKNVAYIWVTYTDVKQNALKDLNIIEVNPDDVPAEYKDSSRRTYKITGDAFTFGSDGKYYAIYSGSTGEAVTDIIVSDNVFEPGCIVMSGKDDSVPSYMEHFINMKQSVEPNELAIFIPNVDFNNYAAKIIIGNGSTGREAQLDLLKQGCRSAIPYDLNTSDTASSYIGIVYKMGYENAFTSLKLKDFGQQKPSTQVFYSRYTYKSVSGDLNLSTPDSSIYVFGLSDINQAMNAVKTKNPMEGRYITDIAFFAGDNLNDYVDNPSLINSLGYDESEYVRSIITDENGNPKYWCIVGDFDGKSVNVNTGRYDSNGEPVKIYMYIHYTTNQKTEGRYLAGTVLTDTSIALIVTIAAVVVISAAATVIVLRKKRENIK